MDEQDRLGSVIESIAGQQFGDAINQAAQSTSISLDSTGGLMLMLAFILFAVSGVIKQARPLAQPFAEVAAEGLRENRKRDRQKEKRQAEIEELELKLARLKAEDEESG